MRAIALVIQSKLVALALGCAILPACSTDYSDDYGFVYEGDGGGREGQRSILIAVSREAYSSANYAGGNSASLSFRTASGTAVSGVDFVPTSGTLSWGEGHYGTRGFAVELIDDSLVEGTENFQIEFFGASEPMQFLNPVTIRIADDDGEAGGLGGMVLTYVIEIGEDEVVKGVWLRGGGLE